jgi:dolichyl-phosphate beta-glucosyltransferase
MQNNLVSVVIPLFNESQRILPTLNRIGEYQKTKSLIREIILVDDASTDNTLEVISQIKDFNLPVKIIKNQKNMGKGFSVKRGVNDADGGAILFMDADNSVDISYLSSFVEYLDRFDVVIASIETKGAKIVSDNNNPLRRKFGHLAKKLINFVALKGIEDSQRGFKLFSKRAADIIFNKQTINRWGFDIEILLIAQRYGFKIKELPINWNNAKSNTVGLISYLPTFLELAHIKFNDMRGLYR